MGDGWLDGAMGLRDGRARSVFGLPGVWLALGILGAVVVAGSYVIYHPHPANYGGLFLDVIESISRDFRYPDRVPNYTNGGIPWAYPPLIFYLDAVALRILPVSGMDMARVMPAAVWTVSIVPYFALARTMLDDERAAGIAAFIYAVTPAAYEWIITGGGVIRAPALVLALSALYSGVRLFRDGGRRWLVTSTVLFGLTLLSHPVMAFGVGISHLYFFVAYSRSPAGLLRGVVVAAGGLVVTSPWLLAVISNHGLDPFVSVLGTAGGGYGVNAISPDIWDPFGRFLALYYVFAVLGAALQSARRDFVVVGWVPVLLLSLTHLVLWFVPAAMLAAVFVVDFVDLLGDELSPGGLPTRRQVEGVVVLSLLVYGLVSGGIYAAGFPAMDRATPMRGTMDDGDVQAMHWIERETSPDATVAVVGREGEWLPYLTNRTSTFAWWGLEWGDPDRRLALKRLYSRSLDCQQAACFARVLSDSNRRIDYLYVSRDRVTPIWPDWGTITESLVESGNFTVVYETDSAIVVRYANATVDSVDPEAVVRSSDRDTTPRAVGTPPMGDRAGQTVTGRSQD
ncbi:MAG: glycosyltransferase family 39 protein [Halanaeroarchaeum sp.]